MNADHDEEEVTGSGCGEGWSGTAWMMRQFYQNWMLSWNMLLCREHVLASLVPAGTATL